MSLILKIAAGVIIGLLLFQFIVFQQVQVNVADKSESSLHAEDLNARYMSLTNSIRYYYRKHKQLPEFISDLKCTDRFNNNQIMTCASVASNGIFYLNVANGWVSAEPYILDQQVYYNCRKTPSLAGIDENFRDCMALDITSIPEMIQPHFNCDTTVDTAEKIICSSDRLIKTDNKLSSIYKDMLAKSAEEKHQEILQDKVNFNQKRSMQCQTSDCIEIMTEAKITRLLSLGTRDPGIK